MLEAIELCKNFRQIVALDHLNIKIESGEIFGLLGANGAGKTTTINLFLDLIKPTSGQAWINGVEVRKNSTAVKQYLAYIPEQVMLYRHMTGLENLKYFGALGGCHEYQDSDWLQILEKVGLGAGPACRRVSEYSKGMRQKICIALAMARHAKALFLDEPTSGLDPKSSDDFARLVKRLAEIDRTAVLMATHDLFRAKETCTRVGIMKNGRLIETLTTNEISHMDLEKTYLDHMRV